MKPAISHQPWTGRLHHDVRITHHSSLITLILAFLSICAVQPVAGAQRHPPVIVVIANYLSLQDLMNAGPSASFLLENSAVALVNTGPERKPVLDARYLAMAAGTRAIGVRDALGFYQADETIQGRSAGDIYLSQMGGAMIGPEVVCIGLPRLLRANKQPAFREESIGLIGDAFHKAGLCTAVVGNSDMPDKPLRLAGLLTMDRKGIVDSGVVSPADMPIERFGTYDPDKPQVRGVVSTLLRDHSLVVIEMGCLNRLESMRADMTDRAYASERGFCISDVEMFLGDMIIEAQRSKATLIVVTPCRSQSDGRWSNLTPVIVFRADRQPGLLKSATARTPGLISNIDIAPTIISAAGLKAPDFVTGRPAIRVRTDTRQMVKRLERMERIAVRNYGLQIPVLVCIGAIVFTSATATEIALRRRIRARLRRLLGAALLVSFSLPAALLLVDGLEGEGIARYALNLVGGIAVVLGISCVIAILLGRLRRDRRVSLPGAVFLATSVLVLGDVLTGAKLLRWSIISCDLITGFRYYGIGNEYMGVLIGASLMAAILFLRSSSFKAAKDVGDPAARVEARPSLRPPERTTRDRRTVVRREEVLGRDGGAQDRQPRVVRLGERIEGRNTVAIEAEARAPGKATPWLIAVWFAFVAFVIGYPGFGANVGGLITAVPTFGVALMALNGVRIRAGHVIGLVAVGFAVVVAFAAMDVASGEGSHLGRSILLARTYGWDWLGCLIGGKILMHLGILRLPQTYIPVVLGIPFFVLYGRRMKSKMTDVAETDLLYRVGVPSVLAGIITAFLFNDSGVVPAAFMFAMFALTIQYVRLTESEDAVHGP